MPRIRQLFVYSLCLATIAIAISTTGTVNAQRAPIISDAPPLHQLPDRVLINDVKQPHPPQTPQRPDTTPLGPGQHTPPATTIEWVRGGTGSYPLPPRQMKAPAIVTVELVHIATTQAAPKKDAKASPTQPLAEMIDHDLPPSQWLDHLLPALEKQGKTLRRYRCMGLTTVDGCKAFCQSGARVARIAGTQIARSSSSSSPAITNNVTMENVGTIFAVTPKVMPDGSVLLECDFEISTLSPEEEGTPISVIDGKTIRTPSIDVSTTQSAILLKRGEATVLDSGQTVDDTGNRVEWATVVRVK